MFGNSTNIQAQSINKFDLQPFRFSMLDSPLLNESNEQDILTKELSVQTSTSSKKTTAYAVGITGVSFCSLLVAGSFAWWKDAGFTGHLELYDSGGFGRSTYAGGSDKAGHVYSCYVGVRAMKYFYEMAGLDERSALWLSTAFVALTGTTVELIDGFTPFKFEYGDVIADLTGVATAFVFESFPAANELFGLRISYIPTTELIHSIKNNYKTTYIKTINDYSGMMFYADFKPAGLEKIWNIPVGFMRYLMLGITYNTYGYAPSKERKERDLGFYIGLNLSELLFSGFGKNTSIVNGIARLTCYYAVPYTNVVVNRDLNNNQTEINAGAANRFEKKL
jgi:hypothetical protein